MRTLFALHGFAGDAGSFGRLAEGVEAPWLSGHGPTPDFSSSSFEEEVARMLALAAKIPGPLWLVGYSQGARVALGMLAREGKLFERAILFGVNPGLATAEERANRIRFDGGFCRLLETGGIGAFVDHWESLPIFETQSRLPATVLERQRRARLAHDPRGLIQALRVLGLGAMPSYWEELPRVQTPIHLVAGELDSKFVELHARAAELLPNVTLEVIPGVGHNPLLEAAAHVRGLLLPENSRDELP